MAKFCFADSFRNNSIANNDDTYKRKPKRKLEGTGEEDTENYHPMRFYFDMVSFNAAFPYSEATRTNFLNALTSAAKILSNLIYVDRSDDSFKLEDNTLSNLGILNWNTTLFEIGSGKYNNFDEYDYFVLFKFSDNINEDAIPVIIASSSVLAACGCIEFKEIEESLLTSDYLNRLILKNLIRLIGFYYDDTNYDFIEEEEDHYFIQLVEDENIIEIYENNGIDINGVPTRVINYAKQYFDCDSITRIEIEIDNDNIYWPKRLLLGEIMASGDYSEEQIISGFTLAFLDGLETMKINKNYTGGLMRFGKHKGCEFFYKECNALLGEDKILFANEFYFPSDMTSNNPEPSCSSGRISKTIYKLDSSTTGNSGFFNCLDSKNYGPIALFNDENEGDQDYLYTGHCFDSTIHKDSNLYEETGSDSFCVLSSLVDESIVYVSKVRAVCYQMICSALSLTIKINDNYIVCPRSGGTIKAEGFNGYILCPDYNLICTGTTLCNNIIDCLDNNSEEKEDTFNYNYTIQTTQNSEEYSSGNILLDIEGELDTVEEEGKTIMCPYKCIQCKADKYCLKCAPHFDIDGEDHTKCVELVPNCEIFKEVTTDICRGCKEGFFLVKENNGDFTCEEESDDNKEKYFYVETQEETEDEEGLTYYKRCDSEVPFCKACSSKTKCTECISNDYTLIDNGEICGILSTKKYYEVSEGNYKSCSKNPSNQFCEKCELVDGNYVCLSRY